MTSFLVLAWASTQPVIKVLLLCGIGALCARKVMMAEWREWALCLCLSRFFPGLLKADIVFRMTGWDGEHPSRINTST